MVILRKEYILTFTHNARQLIPNIIRFLGHVSIILQINDENNLLIVDDSDNAANAYFTKIIRIENVTSTKSFNIEKSELFLQ